MSHDRWMPVAGVDVARHRAEMLARARSHFAEQGVLEIDTPALSLTAVSDPNIDSIPADLSMYPRQTAYLHTSPEYCMKRLLAADFPDIGSICRVFRDRECGRRHQPEFTMIEWYRLGFGLDDMITDTLAMIAAVLDDESMTDSARRMSYADACRRYADIDTRTATAGDLAARLDVDDALRQSLGDDRDAWLDLIVTTEVAPRFDPDRLTCIYHYPASQAALARLCPGDDTVADRFEIFCGDLELANGYVELTDPAEQRERFAADRRKRQQSGLTVAPVDTALLEALDAGLPQCAGVAVGFDRLLMLAEGADDVRDVLHFPHGYDR